MINKKLIQRDIITANLSSDYTITTGGAYVDIPLNSNVSVGSRLTLSGGGVVIGSGITKVKTSAKIVLPSNKLTTGGKNIVIRKNGSTIVDRNWLSLSVVGNNSLALPSKLIEVKAGDVLKLGYYGAKDDGIQGGVYTCLTVEAVEYK